MNDWQDALLSVREEYDDEDSCQNHESRQHGDGSDHAGVGDPVASAADGLPSVEKGTGGSVLEADGERVEHAVQTHVLPDPALSAHGGHAVAARPPRIKGRRARIRVRGRGGQRYGERICNVLRFSDSGKVLGRYFVSGKSNQNKRA